jgi:hypothetical protein
MQKQIWNYMVNSLNLQIAFPSKSGPTGFDSIEQGGCKHVVR